MGILSDEILEKEETTCLKLFLEVYEPKDYIDMEIIANEVEVIKMNKDHNFKNVADMLEHLNRGAEVGFLYDGKEYFMSLTPQADTSGYLHTIYECENEKSVGKYMTAEEMLEYSFGDKRLKDIVYDMEVIELEGTQF